MASVHRRNMNGPEFSVGAGSEGGHQHRKVFLGVGKGFASGSGSENKGPKGGWNHGNALAFKNVVRDLPLNVETQTDLTKGAGGVFLRDLSARVLPEDRGAGQHGVQWAGLGA